MSKITGYDAVTAPAGGDVLPVVDVSDTSMAATGTTKKITLAQVSAGITPVLPSGDATGATDTAAIQAALDDGPVQLGPGTFHVNDTITFNTDGLVLRGCGAATVIQPVSGATFDVIATPIPASSGTAGYTREYCAVESLAIDCADMAGTTAGKGNAIHFYGARYCTVRDVLIGGAPNWCVLLDGDITNFGYNCLLDRCVFDTCAAGVMTYGSEANDITDCIFKYATTACAAAQPAFTPRSTTAYHLLMTSGYQQVRGCVFGNGGTYTTEAVRCENSGPCRITGNRFDLVRYAAFHCTSGGHVFSGNQVGNASAIGSVAAIQLGSGGNTVTGNVLDTTNGAAHWTYGVEEQGAYTGNVVVGNALKNGTAGYVSVNAGSTGQQVAYNAQIP